MLDGSMRVYFLNILISTDSLARLAMQWTLLWSKGLVE